MLYRGSIRHTVLKQRQTSCQFPTSKDLCNHHWVFRKLHNFSQTSHFWIACDNRLIVRGKKEEWDDRSIESLPGSGDQVSEDTADAQLGSVRGILLALLLIAAAAVTLSGTGSTILNEVLETLAAGDADSPVLSAVFILVYAIATVLLFPASVLTLAAGAIFGPLKGTILVSAASTLGATLAFLTSRYLVQPLVEKRLEENPKLQAVIKGISSQGFKLVLLLRLSPVFPFNLLNYALGATSISLVQYVGASWLGMIPGTCAYVLLGGAGRAAAAAATSNTADTTQLLLYGVGAAATLAVTKLVSDAASKSLNDIDQS